MFTDKLPGNKIDTAGALSTDDITIYQAAGALTVVGTVGACTIGGLMLAPAPVSIALGTGVGLAMFGDRITSALDSDKKPESDTQDKTTESAPVADAVA